MTVTLSGSGLTVDALVRIARHGEAVALHPEARARIARCRELLERKIAEGEIMYGVNTGIGELASVALSPEQTREFQRWLIYNHSAGIGEPAPPEHVRGAMVGRINVHARGHSGCRPRITEILVEMLNAGVTPVVCEKGSVGACGDLSPMSQIALAVMGEGECWWSGKRLPSKEAFAEAGIEWTTLQARDGLALINGSNLLTAMSALCAHDTEAWLKQAEIAAAMSLDALGANLRPYDRRLHQLRGFSGSVVSAGNILKVLQGGDVATPGKLKVKVQDAYSMRSTPQVIGAARDHLGWTKQQIEIELNGVGDNPIFLPEDDEVLTGANFQGTPVSLPTDLLGAAVTMVSVLSERRLNRLLNPNLSVGLPAFLTRGAGMFSGMMLSQYSADMLIVEQRILSAPACVQSIPAAADQEDFVSMGMNTALKTRQILKNAYGVLGIEFMAAAQALDLREWTPGAGCRAAREAVREHVAYLDQDRPLYRDHNAMAALVEDRSVLQAVEREVGALD